MTHAVACSQHALGTLKAEASCGLFMFFELLTKQGEAVNGPRTRWGLPHAMHEEQELSQTLHMPSKFIPIAPLEDSQSLFDPYAVLPAGRPGDANSPFWSPISSHTFFP